MTRSRSPLPFTAVVDRYLEKLARAPYLPHRQFQSDTTEPIGSRYPRVQRLYQSSRAADLKYIGRLLGRVVSDALDGHSVPDALGEALLDLVIDLAQQNGITFNLPGVDATRPLLFSEQQELTTALIDIEYHLANEAAILDHFNYGATIVVAGIARDHVSAPAEQGPGDAFQVPLVHLLRDPADCIQKLLVTFIGQLAPEGDVPKQRAFKVTREQLFRNLLAASRVSEEQARAAPHRVVLPEDSDITSLPDLAQAYLAHTPFLDFLMTPVPFPLTQFKAHHWAIYGRTGHGKTQLLQSLILAHLQEPAPQAMIIIDSQGQEGMLSKVERLDLFTRDPDRLLVIDAEADPSPALNMFDVPRLDEAAEIDIIDLYGYIFKAIDADLTSRQGTAFSYIVRLMLAHPGATIMTLLELMEEKVKAPQLSKFWPTIATLDPIAQSYFANRFFSPATNQTKEQLATRLYGILRIKAIGRMFTAQANKLDLFQAMQDRRVVLISTAGLGEASSLFGRYMIALAMRAAFQRASIPERERNAVLLFVDEAFDVMDSNINRILIQARKFGLFIRFATQQYDQIAHDIRAAAAANTEVKLAGGLSAADCRTLAPDMRTTPEFLMSTTRVDRQFTEFACFVQNVTPSALKLKIPYGALERAPRMDEVTYQSLARAARLRFGAPPALPAPPAAQEPATSPAAAPQPARPGLVTLPHKVDVVFPDHAVTLPALLDSGASMSCLPADQLRVAGGRARFVLIGKELEAPVLRQVTLTGFTGKAESGPVVSLRITIAGFTAPEEFALIRGSSALIGRTFLSGRILVDPTEPASW